MALLVLTGTIGTAAPAAEATGVELSNVTQDKDQAFVVKASNQYATRWFSVDLMPALERDLDSYVPEIRRAKNLEVGTVWIKRRYVFKGAVVDLDWDEGENDSITFDRPLPLARARAFGQKFEASIRPKSLPQLNFKRGTITDHSIDYESDKPIAHGVSLEFDASGNAIKSISYGFGV